MVICDEGWVPSPKNNLSLMNMCKSLRSKNRFVSDGTRSGVLEDMVAIIAVVVRKMKHVE